MFTFAVITYNHERFIIEHLESIKYQIKNFDNDGINELLVCDDKSNDLTLELVSSWIRENKELFSKVRIISNGENLGVVKNFLKISEVIESKKFKILGGDDLYYKNDIYSIEENFDIVFSPIIAFEKEVVKDDIYRNDRLCLKYSSLAKLRKYLKYVNLFNAPGAFIGLDIIKNEKLRDFLSRFSWIEDLPMWYYLFFNMDSIKYCFKTKPYILYRRASGISTKRDSSRFQEYYSERNRIFKEFGMKLFWLPKYLNPYKLHWELVNMKIKHFDSKRNLKIIEFNKVISKELEEAPTYLKYIRDCAEKFYRVNAQ